MDQHDEWLQQTADQALREIARFHEYALQAVWGQYPAPQPRHGHPDASAWPAEPDSDPPGP